jgi:hypothetical protein
MDRAVAITLRNSNRPFDFQGRQCDIEDGHRRVIAAVRDSYPGLMRRVRPLARTSAVPHKDSESLTRPRTLRPEIPHAVHSTPTPTLSRSTDNICHALCLLADPIIPPSRLCLGNETRDVATPTLRSTRKAFLTLRFGALVCLALVALRIREQPAVSDHSRVCRWPSMILQQPLRSSGISPHAIERFAFRQQSTLLVCLSQRGDRFPLNKFP